MKIRSSTVSRARLLLPACALILAASSAGAAIAYTTYSGEGENGDPFFVPALTGTTSTSIWYNVRGAGGTVSVEDGGTGVVNTLGSFPGTGAFADMAAQVGDSSAVLRKVANGTGGGPYAAGESVYFGGFSSAVNNPGGTLAVRDTTPIAGLKTVVFQIQIGEAWTYDFVNGTLPVLNYTTEAGETLNLTASFSALTLQISNGTIAMPSGEEPLFNNTYALQWDLSEVESPITSFNVSFSGVQHSQLFGLRLDQSSSAFSASVVPEPSAALLGSIAGLFLLRRRR